MVYAHNHCVATLSTLYLFVTKIIKTRMTTFIKTKFNESDNQTNIDNIE